MILVTIDDGIYWALWCSAWLHFTIHCYTHTSVHSHVFTSRCLVAASNSGHSPSSGFPNYPRPQLPASHSNSSQRLNPNSLTQSLTNQLSWPSPTSCSAYNISTRTAQKTPFYYYCAIVAVETCLSAKPLFRNGCCIVAYFALVA
jgi:hypothetical protein